MIEIRFKDIDPDTGKVSQDKKICTCESEDLAKWVLYALQKVEEEADDPNREVYLMPIL